MTDHKLMPKHGEAFVLLLNDATDKGRELAIALGWSCIRIAGDEVAERLVDIIKRAKDGCGND